MLVWAVIEIEFVGSSFFSQDATARAAIEAAADHVGDAITSTLTPIDQVAFTDTAGNTTATLDWAFAFLDPITDEPIGNFPTAVTNPSLNANTVRVFVDAQPLDGNDVGIGVPAGAEADIGASFIPPLNAAAIQGVANEADAEMNRGGDGPLIGVLFEGNDNLNGNIDVDPVRFRSSFGGIAFDIDTDDNDLLDTDQQLLDFWHLDHTTAVEPTKIDLFSVAVSEILAGLGFGTSNSFEELVSGLDWNGGEVADLIDSGENVLDPFDPNNVRSGTLSNRLSDGAVQQAALDPDITAGVREELTLLDLAFLRDIGWQTVDAVPGTPGDANGDGAVDLLDLDILGANFGSTDAGVAQGDFNGDGNVDLLDLDILGANFGNVSAVSVPEPATQVLVACVTLAARFRS
ncbi:MAG: dockerin type I domain-containing protein [Planctomycetota bacterium]